MYINFPKGGEYTFECSPYHETGKGGGNDPVACRIGVCGVSVRLW